MEEADANEMITGVPESSISSASSPPIGLWGLNASLVPLVDGHRNKAFRTLGLDRDLVRTRLGVVLLRGCAIAELLRVKHRIDAKTDPEKAWRETIEWIKRLRDMRRLEETRAPGVFLPHPSHAFVGRAEALEMLYAALGNALFPHRARTLLMISPLIDSDVSS